MQPRTIFSLCCLSLLTACGNVQPSAISKPPIQRSQGYKQPMQQGDKLRTQSGDSLQDVLDRIHALLKGNYYGYSKTDLDALYEDGKHIFTEEFGDLKTHPLDKKAIDYLKQYVAAIKDGHTYFQRGTSDKELDTPSFYKSQTLYGWQLQLIPSKKGLLIRDIDYGGPAYKAGIRRGGIITAFNNELINDKATEDAYQAVLQQDSTISVTFHHAGQEKTVNVESAERSDDAKMGKPWGELLEDKETYYIRIPTFENIANQTVGKLGQLVHEQVSEAIAKKAANIVVDLRGNGGGSLAEMLVAAFAFVSEKHLTTFSYFADNTGLQVSMIDDSLLVQDRQFKTYYIPLANLQKWKGKLAVLVDHQSASGAEYLAYILSTTKAKIIGKETKGLGNTGCQQFELAEGHSIFITNQRIRLKIGERELPERIIPDIEVDNLAGLDQAVDLPLLTALQTFK